jgi:DNA-binding PadR family transcriptional regulator
MKSILTTTEGAVLGLLAFGERSGYDLARLAATSVAHLWTPSQSQIYKTLPRLLERGLARRREVVQRTRPDKSLYRITAPGGNALREWLDVVEEEPASGRVVFPLKLFFCEFASAGTAQAQLAGYRRFLERRLDSYEAIRESPPDLPSDYPRFVLEHGIARVGATLAWIDETTATLEPPAARYSPPSARRSSRGTSLGAQKKKKKKKASSS